MALPLLLDTMQIQVLRQIPQRKLLKESFEFGDAILIYS